MFSLIFYCGLISSVVSAHFNNDTSHDGDELDINTTLSTLAPTTIPVSKDCVLEMKENEISQIVDLFNSNLVNVVVIYISFSNSSRKGQLFSDFYVSLSNPIGREILYALERPEFRLFQWTLKVGIGNFKLNVKGSQNDCIKTGKNATDFALESTQHIVDSINLATNYQVCSYFKETPSGKAKKTCCQMTKSSLATKFNYKCPKGNSFLFRSDVTWFYINLIMIVFSMFYVIWLLLVFLSRTEFDLKYPEYYKLEESNMSPSSILLKVVWDENGRVVSFIRFFVIVGVYLYFWYLQGWITVDVSIIDNFLSVVWGLSFFIFNLFRSRITNSALVLNRIKQLRMMGKRCIPRAFWEESNRSDFEIIVNIITLPFNPNVWRIVKEVLYKQCTGFARRVTEQSSNCILKLLGSCAYYVLAVLICFVCVCIVLFFYVGFLYTSAFLCLWYLLLLACILEYRTNNFYSRILIFCQAFSLFFYYMFSIIIAIWSIVAFLLGLFLNLFYFIPYFAFFSVLTFYCCTYWKTLEEQYSVLKRLIYEACRETQNINNGCIPNRHPKPNEDVIPVVSKRLYGKIREELLPYDTNLFYFILKIFWSIAFSYVIFTLINRLNEFNVTGLVQVITTASLGVIPHVFNMVALKTNEERKKAKNEKLKLNVKYRVEELISENVKLYDYLIKNAKNTTNKESTEDSKPLKHIARTVLIIEQEIRDNETRPGDLSSCLGVLKYISGWYLLEIDDVENDQQAPPVMLEDNNVTTDDENTEDSEHFETMFGIDCFDNDEIGPTRTATAGQNSKNPYDNVDCEDGQLDEIMHRNRKTTFDDIKDSEEQPLVQQNNDVIVEENHQNSKNAHGNIDGDDGKLAVIVHRNREALIEDIKDSEEQPLVQQNNDAIVKENHQNSKNTHGNIDGDDGKLAVIVHRNREALIEDIEDSEEQPLVQQNNDTIVEENHKNCGNTHHNVDANDGKLAVIVHRNRKTMINDIEDPEEQPLVQQNNDVTVKESDQNSVFEYCKLS